MKIVLLFVILSLFFTLPFLYPINEDIASCVDQYNQTTMKKNVLAAKEYWSDQRLCVEKQIEFQSISACNLQLKQDRGDLAIAIVKNLSGLAFHQMPSYYDDFQKEVQEETKKACENFPQYQPVF